MLEWLARPRNKKHLLGKNVNGKEITIGPMNEQLNHVDVYYSYKYSEHGQRVFHRSGAATLHLLG